MLRHEIIANGIAGGRASLDRFHYDSGGIISLSGKQRGRRLESLAVALHEFLYDRARAVGKKSVDEYAALDAPIGHSGEIGCVPSIGSQQWHGDIMKGQLRGQQAYIQRTPRDEDGIEAR